MKPFERVGSQTDILGESPVWDVQTGTLYWTDIRNQLVRRCDWAAGRIDEWKLPEMVGSLTLRKSGGLLLALKSGLAFFDTDSGMLERLAAPEKSFPERRFNDGKCDRQGRFFAGTMNDVTRAPEGTLYRFDGASCVPVETAICIPNSLCWGPDGRTMYFADSLTRTVSAYDYDPATGTPSRRRALFSVPAPAIPDGCTVDEQGCLWCAEYDGWRISRYAPTGERLRTIELPLQRPTSCMFGGPDLDILFVTTASQKLSAEELARQPLAGALLAMDVGVRGVAEARFEG
ncbi:MAG: SMP-30/gluconolactonase/LRE family protein [Burkholderiales bacterium]